MLGSPCSNKATATVTLYVEYTTGCNLIVFFKTAESGSVVVCRAAGSSRILPISDAWCAAIGPTVPPLFYSCQYEGGNGAATLTSAVGPPSAAAPFIATFSGVLFYDADDAPFLTNAVVSE